MSAKSKFKEMPAVASRGEEGQTMAEYGVVLAVITIGAVLVFTALSGAITDAIQSVIDLLPGG